MRTWASLEIRPSAVTAQADVVLPVAPHAEKAGSFVDWEGRVREVGLATPTNAVSDFKALDMLADAMGDFFGTRTVAEVRDEMTALGPWTGARAAAPTVEAGDVPEVSEGLVLATWRPLLDKGTLQDGEPFLAGTAPKAVAKVSASTAERLGVSEGETVTVRSGTTSVRVPLAIAEMADLVVWLPTNSADCDVRALLANAPGTPVLVTKGGDQ